MNYNTNFELLTQNQLTKFVGIECKIEIVNAWIFLHLFL